MNARRQGRFKAYSAGSHPNGRRCIPMALQTLRDARVPTDGLRSKSWDEFAAPARRRMDFVITVCDHAAGEVCPFWPGQPMTAHWGCPTRPRRPATTRTQALSRARWSRCGDASQLLLALPCAEARRHEPCGGGLSDIGSS